MRRFFARLFGKKSRRVHVEGRRPAVRLKPTLEILEDRALPSLAVPALSSKPDAPASVYLDFDGHYQQCYGHRAWSITQGYHCEGYLDVNTPAFDLDGNT